MNRTGSLTLDFVTAFAWLGVLGILFVGVGQELRSDSWCDDRRGRLETAQNILDGLRHAQTPVLPPGWRLTRQSLGGTLLLVHVIGPGCDLGSLLAVTQPSPRAATSLTPTSPAATEAP